MCVHANGKYMPTAKVYVLFLRCNTKDHVFWKTNKQKQNKVWYMQVYSFQHLRKWHMIGCSMKAKRCWFSLVILMLWNKSVQYGLNLSIKRNISHQAHEQTQRGTTLFSSLLLESALGSLGSMYVWCSCL